MSNSRVLKFVVETTAEQKLFILAHAHQQSPLVSFVDWSIVSFAAWVQAQKYLEQRKVCKNFLGMLKNHSNSIGHPK